MASFNEYNPQKFDTVREIIEEPFRYYRVPITSATHHMEQFRQCLYLICLSMGAKFVKTEYAQYQNLLRSLSTSPG